MSVYTNAICLAALARPLEVGPVGLIAQGVYVATHEGTDAAALFSDEAFLGQALHRTGAYDWLTRAGARLPDWPS
jgi:hypothetical protein